ncbi:MAG: class I SAM-dependent methyltransferase [Candidatus Kapabacteria bacterium]|nr:class I SAM-dependent methyltransferase [Candidatus Kapabacteria bacterium]
MKKIQVINGFLEYGTFIRAHSNAKKFNDKFKMYDFVNSLTLDKPILYLEFGVFEGLTFKYWVSLNNNPKSLFFGFDSFEGLPEDWKGVGTIYSKGFFDTKGQIPQINDERAGFIKGIFQNTLIPFLENNSSIFSERQLIVHLDADLYSSELYVLCQLFKYIKPDTILIFDDFSVPNHDFRAFNDWSSSHLIDYEVLAFTFPNYIQSAIKINSIRNNYI